ncbi:MAG: DUF1905 domain-containing protein [Phycisphaerae bacterium]|nr:DUF1905 domain-containing protein [Phycisphaerae bacterium]
MPTPAKNYSCTLQTEGGTSMCAIPVPFDPKPVFGRVRAPVRVTVNGYTYRSTICAMAGCWWIPLRKSHQEAAKLSAGQRVRVKLALDEQPRTITPPTDLARALRAAGLAAAWKSLAYTHQREHAEAVTAAKKPETRARRIENCLAMLRKRK